MLLLIILITYLNAIIHSLPLPQSSSSNAFEIKSNAISVIVPESITKVVVPDDCKLLVFTIRNARLSTLDLSKCINLKSVILTNTIIDSDPILPNGTRVLTVGDNLNNGGRKILGLSVKSASPFEAAFFLLFIGYKYLKTPLNLVANGLQNLRLNPEIDALRMAKDEFMNNIISSDQKSTSEISAQEWKSSTETVTNQTVIENWNEIFPQSKLKLIQCNAGYEGKIKTFDSISYPIPRNNLSVSRDIDVTMYQGDLNVIVKYVTDSSNSWGISHVKISNDVFIYAKNGEMKVSGASTGIIINNNEYFLIVGDTSVNIAIDDYSGSLWVNVTKIIAEGKIVPPSGLCNVYPGPTGMLIGKASAGYDPTLQTSVAKFISDWNTTAFNCDPKTMSKRDQVDPNVCEWQKAGIKDWRYEVPWQVARLVYPSSSDIKWWDYYSVPYWCKEKKGDKCVSGDGSGVTVFVIDRPIDKENDDFKGSFTIPDSNGEIKDTGFPDADIELSPYKIKQDNMDHLCYEKETLIPSHPEFGHGTNVAQMIVGRTSGISPFAKVISISPKFEGSYDKWISRSIDCVKLHLDATPEGKFIINLSIQIEGGFTPESVKKIQTFQEMGVIIVTAAGNEDETIEEQDRVLDNHVNVDLLVKGDKVVFDPFTLTPDSVIHISAIDANNDPLLAYGKDVDLYAPGRRVDIKTDYGSKNIDGTSFAAPLAAGVVANIWSRSNSGPDWQLFPTNPTNSLAMDNSVTANRMLKYYAGLDPQRTRNEADFDDKDSPSFEKTTTQILYNPIVFPNQDVSENVVCKSFSEKCLSPSKECISCMRI